MFIDGAESVKADSLGRLRIRRCSRQQDSHLIVSSFFARLYVSFGPGMSGWCVLKGACRPKIYERNVKNFGIWPEIGVDFRMRIWYINGSWQAFCQAVHTLVFALNGAFE